MTDHFNDRPDALVPVSAKPPIVYSDVQFLESVVKALVDHPDDVRVERRTDEMGVLLSLRVHPDDMGQVIGREGATAKAIRSLLRIVGIRNSARVNLKIEEPETTEAAA
jgi:uncharacterized protein